MHATNNIGRWAETDRPREKLMNKSPDLLTDSELLAILIGNGTARHNATDLAKEVLKMAVNNLQELGKLSVHELTAIKGIGHTKALTIVAAMELARRRQAALPLERPGIDYWDYKAVASYLRALFQDLPYEVFAVIYLNTMDKVKHFGIHSQGGINKTIIDQRLIFKKALEVGAVSIILCHNHPSGNPAPSDADIIETARIKDAGKIIGIMVRDHIIVSEQGYYSFREKNRIFT